MRCNLCGRGAFVLVKVRDVLLCGSCQQGIFRIELAELAR